MTDQRLQLWGLVQCLYTWPIYPGTSVKNGLQLVPVIVLKYLKTMHEQ